MKNGVKKCNVDLMSTQKDSPVPLPDPSLFVGGGLLVPSWDGVGDEGGGGAGPLVGVWLPGEGAVLLLLRELWRCGSSGATSPLTAGPLVMR